MLLRIFPKRLEGRFLGRLIDEYRPIQSVEKRGHGQAGDDSHT